MWPPAADWPPASPVAQTASANFVGTGLQDGVNYTCRVRAYVIGSDTGDSAYSATANGTTTANGSNLVLNPSFETDLSNWGGWQSTLSRVSGGQDGTYAARAAFNGCQGCTRSDDMGALCAA